MNNNDFQTKVFFFNKYGQIAADNLIILQKKVYSENRSDLLGIYNTYLDELIFLKDDELRLNNVDEKLNILNSLSSKIKNCLVSNVEKKEESKPIILTNDDIVPKPIIETQINTKINTFDNTEKVFNIAINNFFTIKSSFDIVKDNFPQTIIEDCEETIEMIESNINKLDTIVNSNEKNEIKLQLSIIIDEFELEFSNYVSKYHSNVKAVI